MHLKIYLEERNICVTMGTFFSPGENIQHAIVPCQMTHTTIKVYNQQENVSFNIFNNNEAIEPKQREKTVDGNTDTVTMSVEQLCASVYMWNEGSHSSDVCWFRVKFEWERAGRQDDNPLGEGVIKKMSIMRVFYLTFQGENQLLLEI